jgi:hypothetical protein
VTMTIEDLMRQADPVDRFGVPTIDAESSRSRLDQIVATPVTVARIRRPHALAMGLVAAAALALIVFQVLPSPVGQPSPAAAAFLNLSRVASILPRVEAPASGQCQYTKSVSVDSAEYVDLLQYPFFVNYYEQRQVWVSTNGSGRLVESWSDPTFPTAHDRSNWVRSGSPSLAQAPVVETMAPATGTTAPIDLWALPTNPTQLASMLSSRSIEAGPSGALEDFTQVGDLLRATYAPPALRAALFKVASAIPGVLLIGPTTDHLGRRGVGLAIAQTPSNPAQGSSGFFELIFDPTTSALLGEQTLVGTPSTGTPKGGATALAGYVVTSWTSYEASEVVDSPTAVILTHPSGQHQ